MKESLEIAGARVFTMPDAVPVTQPTVKEPRAYFSGFLLVGPIGPTLPFPVPYPLHPFPFPSTSFPSTLYCSLPSPPSNPLPVEVRPLNPAGGLGSAVSSPSGVCGGAPAEIEFGAF